MDTPRCAPPACTHSHRSGAADTSRNLSLSPCPLRLHDPCRGREGALHACSHLRVSAGGVWRVDTRVLSPSPERSFGGRRMRPPAHTLYRHTAQLPSSALPVHAPLPPLHSSVSTLQLHRGCSPSAGGGCHRAAQRCTHGLTVPSTSRRGQTGVCTGGGGVRQQCLPPTLRYCPLPHVASRCTSSYVQHTTALVQV
jgi:hypothetical protein